MQYNVFKPFYENMMLIDEYNQSLLEYHHYNEQIKPLELFVSVSELHGLICGFISINAAAQGEQYFQALMAHHPNQAYRQSAQVLFYLFTVSQQQLAQDDFAFQLLLPTEEAASLSERAQAFSEWCQGFSFAMKLLQVERLHSDKEDDMNDFLRHIQAFSQLDYEALSVNEDDEKSLFDVTEYTRMAVLRLYYDTRAFKKHDQSSSQEHTHH